MADMKYYIPDAVYKAAPYFVETYIDEFSKKYVSIGITDTDMHILLAGKGFVQKNGELIGGTIKSFAFIDEFGLGTFDISNVDYKITKGNGDALALLRGSLFGNDTVEGTEEADQILGGDGNDKMFGLGGDDSLVGGPGRDLLNGGDGNDTFLFLPAKGSKATIADFDAVGGLGNQDLLNFNGVQFKAFEVGLDVHFKFDGGGLVIVKNVDLGDITTEDFTTSEVMM